MVGYVRLLIIYLLHWRLQLVEHPLPALRLGNTPQFHRKRGGPVLASTGPIRPAFDGKCILGWFFSKYPGFFQCFLVTVSAKGRHFYREFPGKISSGSFLHSTGIWPLCLPHIFTYCLLESMWYENQPLSALSALNLPCFSPHYLLRPFLAFLGSFSWHFSNEFDWFCKVYIAVNTLPSYLGRSW